VPQPRLRLGLAAGFTVVFLAVFAGFGGLGYAKSTLFGGARGTGNAFGSLFGSGKGNSSSTPGGSQGPGGNTGVGGVIASGGGGFPGHGGPPWFHQYPIFVVVCLITPNKDIPIIVLNPIGNLLIQKGVAHAPPCNTGPNPKPKPKPGDGDD
jgi:hypothetical protein